MSPAIAIVVALFAVLAVVELGAYARKTGRPYPRRDAVRALACYLGFFLTTELLRGLAAPLYALVGRHGIAVAPESTWAAWLLAFLGEELLYYWQHRLMHAARFAWAHHRVHHEIRSMTFVTGMQNGWFGVVAGKWLYCLPLALLGFEPQMLLDLMTANMLYNYILHTELAPPLRWLEWGLNTPSLHRVHHSYLPEHIDHNFGAIVSLYDRLFGTFRREQPGEVEGYGLAPRAREIGVFALNLEEWRAIARDLARARRPRSALLAVLGPRPEARATLEASRNA